MNMVEKVARAITLWANDGKTDAGYPMYEDMARAAIEAMREATDRMADDGYRAMHYGADAVWQAMIDAALSE